MAKNTGTNQGMGGCQSLLGACGLYCGACYHYHASLPDGSHLLEEATRRGQLPDAFTCGGCRSERLYIHPGCKGCQIRACTDARGLRHCGSCPEFPCARLEAFREDGHLHHFDIYSQLAEMNRTGIGEWLAIQKSRWQCTCGAAFSWYEERCQRCGAPLASFASSAIGREQTSSDGQPEDSVDSLD